MKTTPLACLAVLLLGVAPATLDAASITMESFVFASEPNPKSGARIYSINIIGRDLSDPVISPSNISDMTLTTSDGGYWDLVNNGTSALPFYAFNFNTTTNKMGSVALGSIPGYVMAGPVGPPSDFYYLVDLDWFSSPGNSEFQGHLFFLRREVSTVPESGNSSALMLGSLAGLAGLLRLSRKCQG